MNEELNFSLREAVQEEMSDDKVVGLRCRGGKISKGIGVVSFEARSRVRCCSFATGTQ